MRLRSLVLTATLLASGAAAAKDELAILPFGGPPDRRVTVQQLEALTRKLLPAYFPKDVQARNVTHRHAETADAILSCDRRETGCLKTFAGMALVEQLITGVLSQDGEVLTLRWYNFRPKEPLVRSMATRLNRDTNKRAADVKNLSACLVGRQCAELAFIDLQPPYEVFIDDVHLRGSPLRIPAGEHEVRIEKPGFLPLILRHRVGIGDKSSIEPVLVAKPGTAVQVKQPEKEPEKIWMPGEG